jgi:RND family efflux transporter MFP subunit
MKKIRLIWILSFLVMMSCGRQMEETKPIRQDLTEVVFASGILEADGSYSLTSQSEGYLAEVNFREGDIVKEGNELATVDNREIRFNTESSTALYRIAQQNLAPDAPALVQAENSILVARKNLILDSINFHRYNQLINSNSVSMSEFENIRLKYEISKANYESALENYRLQEQQAQQALINYKVQKEVNHVMLNNNEIRAVVSGKVYEKKKQRGDFVRTGDVIAVIGDANLLYAKVNIDESNISRIKVGQSAVIHLNTNKERKYEAKVGTIYPAFDESSQSFYCKLFFTDSLDFKIAGTHLEANIVVGHQSNAILIPRRFLNFDGTVQIKGADQPTKVITNFIGTEWVHVVSGLTVDDVVITEKTSARSTSSEEGSSGSN